MKMGPLKRLLRRGYFACLGDKSLDFPGFALNVNYGDAGGRSYSNRGSYEEAQSSAYREIACLLQPDLVVDVGANYGFSSLVFQRNFPDAKLILVEPSPYLENYIRGNMEKNGVTNYVLVRAVCGSRSSGHTSFALNPSSSQDNRVRGPGEWKTIDVPSISLTDLISSEPQSRSVFIKIDTQGFEPQVFEGAWGFMERSRQWLIKTEFAPAWLRAQGNDPQELLDLLVSKFRVAEAPARTRFKRDKLSELLSQPLQPEEIPAFVAHTESLNRSGAGWVDLYVAPRQ